MSTILERYQKLGLRESLSRVYDYPSACNELSFILRGSYTKVPKNLQSFLFQDTLAAFRLLPDMHTRHAISAANFLLQAAEVALPKQKRALAVTEFKHAVVAHKRRCKSHKDQEDSAQLPQDVIVHVFSFLDMRSLVLVGSVCWLWNAAANDNKLWQLQYDIFFGSYGSCSKTNGQIDKPADKLNRVLYQKKESLDQTNIVDWREAFKGAYVGNSSRRFTSNRGYCGNCKSIVWLCNMQCSSVQHGLKLENQQIKPMSPRQVVEYLLEDSLSTISSSDSDSDSDGESISKLWAYSRHIGDSSKKPLVQV